MSGSLAKGQIVVIPVFRQVGEGVVLMVGIDLDGLAPGDFSRGDGSHREKNEGREQPRKKVRKAAVSHHDGGASRRAAGKLQAQAKRNPAKAPSTSP